MNANERSSLALRNLLFKPCLLGVGLPLVLVGTFSFLFLTVQLDVIQSNFARSRDAFTRDVAGTSLQSLADTAARQLDAFLVERIGEAKAWSTASVVVESASAAHARHRAEGLTELPLEAVEDRFRIQKSLRTAPWADTYLRQQLTSAPHFAEIFFTDRNGYNVALTNPTSDFVQSDEDWWQNAWSRGLSVGEIEYDDSAGVWSVDISLRIDDPATEQAVGVMKTVLAIEPVQQMADRTATAIPGGGRMQIIDNSGVLIAETSSNHARGRIINPEVNLREQGSDSVLVAFGAERTGFTTDKEWITGFARTGGRDAYAGVSERFEGFDWIVILQQPVTRVTGSIGMLAAIDDRLRDWRLMLAAAFCTMAVSSILFALVLASRSARRLTASMQSIREMAEHASTGKLTAPPSIEQPEELVRLNEAVHRLTQVLATVLRRAQQSR